MPFTPRVFSGIQPSGELHLGNYLGAIKRFVPLQLQFPCLYCVVDMHAITVWQEPDDLRRKTREVAAAYVAAGVDPKQHIIFNQSRVIQHAELAWIFNCVARMGWMNRMTQWKDKTAGKDAEAASLGLFAYPSLMAADILLYKATHVPVGEDQKQHIELTRDIALKFNTDFDVDLFVPPEPYIGGGAAARVMSLRDGRSKMSKTDPSDMSRINLIDSDELIGQKIRKAKTDPEPLPDDPAGLEERPEAKNLVGIYAAVTNSGVEEVLGQFAGQGFGAFKPALADALIALLAPLRTRLEEFRRDPAELDRLLAEGAARARELGAPTLADAHRAVGLTQ
jgi:tryptophanyl-tRNA synthetase